jgi:uncharacterized protein YcbX
MKSLFSDIMISYLSIGKIDGLYRYPLKGFSGESIESVNLGSSETFPDDRRFALLKHKEGVAFDPENPVWLHKENFLCAFTAPKLMAKYRISFDDSEVLRLYDRSTDAMILPPMDFSSTSGRQVLSDFFSKETNMPLACVTANNHQFGNTSSSWKKKKDTRTIHIVNKATIQELSDAIGVDLLATRFRPNIVLNGPSAWSEWNWIDKKIQLGSACLEVISKTVRCDGISVDPLDQENVLDIPDLMMKYFPEHGPYLGVYAVVDKGGAMSLGDDVSLVQ